MHKPPHNIQFDFIWYWYWYWFEMRTYSLHFVSRLCRRHQHFSSNSSVLPLLPDIYVAAFHSSVEEKPPQRTSQQHHHNHYYSNRRFPRIIEDSHHKHPPPPQLFYTSRLVCYSITNPPPSRSLFRASPSSLTTSISFSSNPHFTFTRGEPPKTLLLLFLFKKILFPNKNQSFVAPFWTLLLAWYSLMSFLFILWYH